MAELASTKLEGRANEAAAVSLPDALPPADFDKLPAHLDPFARMLIVEGSDPDDPQRFKSESEAQWFVTNALVRAGCDKELIAAFLLDPDYGISAHPLRQKRPLDYVVRQISRALEEAAHPLLEQMNADHAVIELYGGKCRVVSWLPSELDAKRMELVAQSFDDFRNRYMHKRVKVGETKEGNPVYSSAGKWWLEHPLRSQSRSVVFCPNGGSDPDDLNLWRGLAVAPRAGGWPLLRELIETVLASGDRAGADYILRWSAFAVQHPECPAEVALTFIGGKGTGKSTFGRVMRRIFGQHGVAIASSKAMTHNFNKVLHDCCLLFADEAVARGDNTAEGIVKSLITEPTVMIEPKGVDAFPATNRLKVIIASNDDWVVRASADERRFAIFNVSTAKAAPPGSPADDERMLWWKRLNAEIENGGIEAFLHDLLAMELGDWHPRYGVPQNAALTGQKAASLRGVERVLYDHLRTGTPPPCHLERIGDGFVLPSVGFQEQCNARDRADISLNDVQALLSEGHRTRDGSIRVPGMGFEKRNRQPKGWLVPSLAEARRRWDERRWPGEWDDRENDSWFETGNAQSEFPMQPTYPTNGADPY